MTDQNAQDGAGRASARPSMRWEGQRLDGETPGVLPGLARVSNLVRSVRTPEFANVTFHEVLSKSALNHVPDTSSMLPGEWTINPYRGCTHGCRYCYARPTHERLGLNIRDQFDNEIVVKVNVVEVLRAELARKRKLPERVALGTSTDPYQRAEGRYALMPGIIDALAGARVPFSILTKGTIIRRDLKRLASASRFVRVELGMSVSILDNELQQSLEPGTPTTAARLDTIRAIRESGLDCTVFIAPILPMMTDTVEQLDALVGALADAGATNVLPTPLYLMAGVKEFFFDWLQQERPELVPAYTRLYANGSRIPEEYRNEIDARMRAALTGHGLPIPDASTTDKFALHGKRKSAPALEPTLF